MELTRKVIIEDKKLKSLLEEKDNNITTGRAIQKKVEELQREQQKIGLHLEKIKGKVRKLFSKHEKKLTLDDFEYVYSVGLVKSRVEVDIHNAVEEFKVSYKEQNKK